MANETCGVRVYEVIFVTAPCLVEMQAGAVPEILHGPVHVAAFSAKAAVAEAAQSIPNEKGIVKAVRMTVTVTDKTH